MAKDPYQYFRVEARELLEGLTRDVLALEKEGAGKELIGRMLRVSHTLKGAARVVKQVEISENAHAIEDVLGRHRDHDGPCPPDDIQRLLRLIDRCGECVDALSSAPDEPRKSSARSEKEETVESVRIEIGQLDATLYDVAESQVHLEALRQEIPALSQLRRAAGRLARHAEARQNRGRAANLPIQEGAAIRSLAGEIRTTAEALDGSIRGWIDLLERDLARLRDRTGEFRLLPAAAISGALERSVHDVSAALQKRVAFEIVGGQQRLDAHVLVALRDALIHAVRNAVAHGIETESERTAAGKPATGTVRLHVERIGQRVLFRVEDDGRGLDIAGIGRVAAARGIVPAEAGEAMDLDRASRILFQGGVSTSSAVSEFSGRGVGLDVVRATAARLKGDTNLRSEPGRGTTLEISVPMSIESMPVLAASIGEMTVLVPFGVVSQVVRTAERDLVHSAGGDVVLVDQQAVPFFPLSRILGLEPPNGAPCRSWSTMIVESGGSRVAIGVDRLHGIRNIVVRPLPAACGPVALVAGAALDGLGNPELVLDLAGLVAAVKTGTVRSERPAPPPERSVLVVDDSLTTRMLEQSILEAAGYRVELATSGEEALVKAREKPHSVFVVDVEMPGMNGFELLRRFRGDPQLQGTPAIMVTSRATPEDRRSADEAGARDYIIKSEFDESRLLRTIRDLIAEMAS